MSLSTSPPTKLVSVQVKCQSKGDDEGTDGKGGGGPSKARGREEDARQSHGAKG